MANLAHDAGTRHRWPHRAQEILMGGGRGSTRRPPFQAQMDVVEQAPLRTPEIEEDLPLQAVFDRAVMISRRHVAPALPGEPLSGPAPKAQVGPPAGDADPARASRRPGPLSPAGAQLGPVQRQALKNISVIVSSSVSAAALMPRWATRNQHQRVFSQRSVEIFPWPAG